MDSRIKSHLYDIKNCISDLDEYFEDNNIPLAQWDADKFTQRFVERNLEIIGEAMHRIVRRDIRYMEIFTDAKQVIGMRNVIIHEYDNIVSYFITDVLENHINLLKAEVIQLLEE